MVAEDKPKAIEVARSTFSRYSFAEQTLDRMTEDLQQHPSQLVDFLMCFHHNLAEDDFASIRAYYSGLTISLGYFFGGLVPLVPYMLINDMYQALIASVVVMGIALFTFGWFKTSLVGDENIGSCFRNALQMVVLGGVAAGAAMGCMKAVG
jgi:VIT1/CCC1 family predicted Fe2+/Mn2+ transporter